MRKHTKRHPKQTGEGWIRDDLPPKIRNFLAGPVGSKPIARLGLLMEPLRGAIKFIVDVISLGTVDAEARRLGYDAVLHNSLLVDYDRAVMAHKGVVVGDTTFKLDKNEVITVKGNSGYKPTFNFRIPAGLTLAVMFKRAMDKYPRDRFIYYSAGKANCQDFTYMMLEASGLYSQLPPELRVQNSEALWAAMPRLSRWITQGTTDLAGVADHLIHGGRDDVKSGYVDFLTSDIYRWLLKNNLDRARQVESMLVNGRAHYDKRFPKGIFLGQNTLPFDLTAEWYSEGEAWKKGLNVAVNAGKRAVQIAEGVLGDDPAKAAKGAADLGNYVKDVSQNGAGYCKRCKCQLQPRNMRRHKQTAKHRKRRRMRGGDASENVLNQIEYEKNEGARRAAVQNQQAKIDRDVADIKSRRAQAAAAFRRSPQYKGLDPRKKDLIDSWISRGSIEWNPNNPYVVNGMNLISGDWSGILRSHEYFKRTGHF